MVSLCSAHQDALNYVHVDLEVTLRSRELRSTFDLDLMRYSYTYFDVYRMIAARQPAALVRGVGPRPRDGGRKSRCILRGVPRM